MSIFDIRFICDVKYFLLNASSAKEIQKKKKTFHFSVKYLAVHM